MKRLILPVLFAVTISGCFSASSPAQPAGPNKSTPGSLTLTSPAFAPGAAIPARYTCQGEDSSPQLEWSDPPAGTKSLALIVDDPDAAAGSWVHWVVYNIPPATRSLPEGASRGKATTFDLPEGAQQGRTSFRRADYGGPCPPSGSHRYFFRIYALDAAVTGGAADANALDASALRKAMEGHVLATGELMGTYQKK